MPTIEKLSDESDAPCACGCGRDAFPFTVKYDDGNYPNGFVDAAPECAKVMLIDAGLLDEEES